MRGLIIMTSFIIEHELNRLLSNPNLLDLPEDLKPHRIQLLKIDATIAHLYNLRINSESGMPSLCPNNGDEISFLVAGNRVIYNDTQLKALKDRFKVNKDTEWSIAVIPTLELFNRAEKINFKENTLPQKNPPVSSKPHKFYDCDGPQDDHHPFPHQLYDSSKEGTTVATKKTSPSTTPQPLEKIKSPFIITVPPLYSRPHTPSSCSNLFQGTIYPEGQRQLPDEGAMFSMDPEYSATVTTNGLVRLASDGFE